jgi:alanine racemase
MDRQAFIDLGAITGNVAALSEWVRGSQVMAVVKADGYGHGMVPAARAALAGGATWLGVVDSAEALALRQAGITAPVLCLMAFGAPSEAIAHGIDLSAGSVGFVDRIAAAAARAGRPARLHLKADTGLSRAGATPRDWPRVVDAALDAEARGVLRVVGLWSHFACADLPGHPSIKAQLTAFTDAVAVAEKAGVTPEVRHIANTAAGLTVPESRLDLVRFGGACYGLSTLPGGAPSWLRPAMSLRARLALVKRVPAFLTATATSRPARPPSAWCRSATRTACPAARPACPWSARAAAGGRSRARSAWTSSSSISATSRSRPAMRWCCSARGMTANPPHRNGARPSPPSPLIWPRVSAPGYRESTWGIFNDYSERHRRPPSATRIAAVDVRLTNCNEPLMDLLDRL